MARRLRGSRTATSFGAVLPVLAAAALGLALAACSGASPGMGGSSLPSVNPYTDLQTVSDAADAFGGRPTATENARSAIADYDAFGSRVKAIFDENFFEAIAAFARKSGPRSASGACENGVEFYAPDRKGDPNSSELLLFYNRACTHVARDVVFITTPTGSNSETIATTTSIYGLVGKTPVATRTDTTQLSNASIGAYGFPNVASGFAAETQGQIAVGSVKSIASDTEAIVLPATSSANVNVFCGDSAGYSITGVPSLGRTFGWQGGTNPSITATRSAGSSGIVTWRATIVGVLDEAAIGGLSIATATPNNSCPVSTPAYTLAGGTQIGSYSIPLAASFQNERLIGVTVKRASLPGGATLSIRTTHRRGVLLVHGIVGSGASHAHGIPIARFVLNAFGNGVLTVTSTGATYAIVDWVVVKT